MRVFIMVVLLSLPFGGLDTWGSEKNDGAYPDASQLMIRQKDSSEFELRQVEPLPPNLQVIALIDAPGGNTSILNGTIGTLICVDPDDLLLPYLVDWGGAPGCCFPQSQVCGIEAANGWWVGADDVDVGCTRNGELIPPPCVGTEGPDTITGTSANEVINGLGGNDTIDGGGGNDVIDGGDGDDQIDGGDGNDVIAGGAGADTLFGGTGDDTVLGGPGDDRLEGGEDNDVVNGGDGNDILFSSNSGLAISFQINPRQVPSPCQGATALRPAIDKLVDTSGNNTMCGHDGIDEMSAGLGNDIMRGFGSNDILTGGPGMDDIDGGLGIDRCPSRPTDVNTVVLCELRFQLP